jgi:hypothetical protein
MAAGQRVSSGAPRHAGQSGRSCRWVPRPLDIVADRRDARRGRPADRPVRDDLMSPATLDELGRLGGPGEPAYDERRSGERGAEHENVASMRIGRPRLGVQVVAVVPDCEQSEIGNRRERGGPSSDDRAHGAPPDSEPPAISLGRAEICGQREVLAAAEPGGHRGVQPGEISGVRHDHQRTPVARDCGSDGLREPVRPRLARERRPGAPGRTPVANGR